MSTTKPDLTRIWAAGAPGGNVIDPDVSAPGKFDDGWLAEVPTFQHFNFLQQLFTQGLAHINEEGICVWDTDTIYPDKAVVKGSDGELYVSQVASNQGNNPVSASAANSNWKSIFEFGEAFLGSTTGLFNGGAVLMLGDSNLMGYGS